LLLEHSNLVSEAIVFGGRCLHALGDAQKSHSGNLNLGLQSIQSLGTRRPGQGQSLISIELRVPGV
jgi:hypothetical protein